MRIEWCELLTTKTKTFYKGEVQLYKDFVRGLNKCFRVIDHSWNEKPKGKGRGLARVKEEDKIDLSGLKF